MALITEDGSGLASADAFISVADTDAFHTAKGNSTWTGDDSVKEAAIRRATSFLSTAYSWKGTRRNGRDQALSWPRYDVTDNEGWPVPYDAVPREIKDACAIVALQELIEPGSMTPAVVPADKVKSEKVGEIAVEYQNARSDAEASRPVLLGLRDIIGPLLANGGGNRLVGRAARA